LSGPLAATAPTCCGNGLILYIGCLGLCAGVSFLCTLHEFQVYLITKGAYCCNCPICLLNCRLDRNLAFTAQRDREMAEGAVAKRSGENAQLKEKPEDARWLSVQRVVVVDNFLRMAQFTSNMTEAYSLAKEVGEDAVWSGLLISSAWGLSFLGALIGWRMAKMGHNLVFWTVKASPRIIVFITLLYVLGANPPEGWLTNETRKHMLLGSRFAYGLLASMQAVLFSINGARVTPASEMVDLEIYKQCARTLGIGGGPLLSALCSYLLLQVSKDSTGLRSSLPAILMMMLWVLFSVTVLQHFPQDAAAMDAMHRAKLEADQVATVNSEAGLEENMPVTVLEPLRIMDARRCVVVMGMLYGIERSFIVSALESATAFILETEFHYSSVAAGLAVGCTFLLAWPAMAALRFGSNICSCCSSSSMGLLKICTHGACLASLLLFKAMSPLILLSCALIFSTSYLASSITDGLALAYTEPGTTLCIENYVLVDQIGQNTLARLLGPVAARLAIRHGGGRATYAAFQVLVSVIGVAICKLLSHCEEICRRHRMMKKNLWSDQMRSTYRTVS